MSNTGFFQSKALLASALCCLLLIPGAASAKTAVGKVIISVGQSVAVDAAGKDRPLKRRAEVFEGDVIKTANKSRLQVRFIDGQLVALKEDTEFKIDEYKFKGKNDGTETASMSLFKGGMRAITGAIGKADKDAYKLKTPVATLGVRGTHYGVFYCAANCGTDAQGKPNKPGLYGGVVDGAIVMTNDTGSKQFNNDQYFHIGSAGTAPEFLLQPPENVFGGIEPSEQGENTGDELPPPDGDGALPPQDDGAPPPPPPPSQTDPALPSDTKQQASRFDALYTGSGLALISTVKTQPLEGVTEVLPPSDFVLGTIGSVSNIVAGVDSNNGTDCSPCVFLPGMASLSEVGGDGMLGVNWGTWNGSSVLLENGNPVTTNNYFSYIYSPNITASLPTSGVGYYNVAGGPALRDQNGMAYSLSGYFDVDFSAQTFTGGSITASGPNSWSLSLPGAQQPTPQPISVLGNGGILLSGTCTGCTATTAAGRVNGAFVGPNAEGIITTIEFKTPSDSVTGVQLFVDFGG